MPPRSTLFPSTALFRSRGRDRGGHQLWFHRESLHFSCRSKTPANHRYSGDRKSTRLNSSHLGISYAAAIYTLSLHGALPISWARSRRTSVMVSPRKPPLLLSVQNSCESQIFRRSEEHTSELQSLRHLVCRRDLHSFPPRRSSDLVGAIAEDISYGFTAKASTSPVGPKLLRITDIQGGTVQWESVPYCNVPKTMAGHYALRRGDIVFART